MLMTTTSNNKQCTIVADLLYYNTFDISDHAAPVFTCLMVLPSQYQLYFLSESPVRIRPTLRTSGSFFTVNKGALNKKSIQQHFVVKFTDNCVITILILTFYTNVTGLPLVSSP